MKVVVEVKVRAQAGGGQGGEVLRAWLCTHRRGYAVLVGAMPRERTWLCTHRRGYAVLVGAMPR